MPEEPDTPSPKVYAITFDGRTIQVQDLKIGACQKIADEHGTTLDGVVNCLGSRDYLGNAIPDGNVMAALVDAAVAHFGLEPGQVFGVSSAADLSARVVAELFDQVDDDVPPAGAEVDTDADPSGGGTSTTT